MDPDVVVRWLLEEETAGRRALGLHAGPLGQIGFQ